MGHIRNRVPRKQTMIYPEALSFVGTLFPDMPHANSQYLIIIICMLENNHAHNPTRFITLNAQFYTNYVFILSINLFALKHLLFKKNSSCVLKEQFLLVSSSIINKCRRLLKGHQSSFVAAAVQKSNSALLYVDQYSHNYRIIPFWCLIPLKCPISHFLDSEKTKIMLNIQNLQ